MRKPACILSLCGTLLASSGAAIAQKRERAQIPDRYTWDLTPIYPDLAAWNAARKQLEARLPAIEPFRGSLSTSADRLRSCLELSSDLWQEYSRLHAWASMGADLDTRDQVALARDQEIRQLGTRLDGALSFIEPEILAMDGATLRGFLASDPGLAIYRHDIEDLQRRKAHTLSEPEEKLMAASGLVTQGPETIYDILMDAEMPQPRITLSTGDTLAIDQSTYSLHRGSAVREDRKQVMQAYFGQLDAFRRTVGAALDSEVKAHLFGSEARHYPSTLHAALDGSNIPVEVYHALIENVNKALPTFHRYLRLRQRMLGVDRLHYYDLYAPLVPGVDLSYTFDEAAQTTLEALKPLGNDYVKVLRQAFDERWVDVYPTPGKRSGAYASGSAYAVHPYMLLNYNGRFEDVGTLAHEAGHAMHSYLSNKTQPFVLSYYPIFVAEVASTVNEALLNDHMLKTVRDEDTRLSLLGDYLEGIKGSLFRQTQFAEFELRIHEMAERGEALTGDALNALYLDISRRYYGHGEGVTEVDDFVASEWIFVSHFFYNYYVYQYATSYTAAEALSEQLLSGDAKVRERYLRFLSAGGSDYPINLLREAGVDMTTAEPFDLTMRRMNRVMDEVEELLRRREARRMGRGETAAASSVDDEY